VNCHAFAAQGRRKKARHCVSISTGSESVASSLEDGDDMSNYTARILGMALFIGGLGACADAGTQDDDQAVQDDEPSIGEAAQALSRCGPVPRRPWPAGCRFTCECSGPVSGPYGEDPNDYSCTGFPEINIGGRPGGECHLISRNDCAFELYCEDD
jgi:hypothetical protein